VNHDLLILKLKSYGFCNPLLSWFSSFLTNIIQNVKYENFISDNIDVTSGVPQGDHLSPLLFLIYINDLSNLIKYSKFLLLADDLKLFKEIRSYEDAVLLQNDVNSFQGWCNDNGMSLNISKCKTISFSQK